MHHSSGRPAPQSDLDCFFDSLATANRKLGRAHGERNALWHLWRLAGCRAGTVTTSFDEIGAAYGCGRGAASNWIAGLQRRGCVEILDQQPGCVRVYVNDPAAMISDRPVRGDPQRELPLDDPAQVSATKPAHDSETCAPSTIPLRPHDSAQLDSPEGLGDAVQREPAQVSESKAARSFIEEDLARAHRSSCMEQSGSLNAPSLRKAALDEQNLRDAAVDLAAARKRETVRPPQPFGDKLTESLHRFQSPKPGAERRRELRDWIRRQIDCPDMDESIAGRAADAVVFNNVPERSLCDVVDRVRKMARAGKIKNSPGALFTHLMKQLCGRHGFEFLGGRPKSG